MSLHITCNMNPTELADKMIEKIKNCWTDPFNPPTVIFPDKYVEEWFCKYWIEKAKDGAALMNLNKFRLDSFLFDILKPEGKEIKLLSSEMLHLVLVKALFSKQYSDKLDSDLQFIFKGEKHDPIKVYDMAGTLADLFMEYEISCPEWFSKISDSRWTGWQEKIYEEHCRTGIEVEGVTYKTLAELYFGNDRKIPDKNIGNRNCFIFGFSGIGKLYRYILSKLSKENVLDIELFIQNGAFRVDVLSDKLGKFGKTNIKELQDISDDPEPDCLKTEPEKTGNYPKEFKLASAPSRIREIEVLHSEICNLIKNGNAITFDDIKVFAPEIREYISAINLVFGEPMISEEDVEKKRSGSKKNDSFGIPFSINDYPSSLSYMADAVSILSDIGNKNYFSRKDFLSLITNPVVRASYGIRDEYIVTWKEWISEMNVFRKRKTDRERDDWNLAKRRLLLSLLTNDCVKCNDGVEEIFPFEGNSDDNCARMFADLIDDLYEWIDLTSDEDSEPEKVKESLRKILSMGRNHDESLKGERDLYMKLMGCIGMYMKVFKGKANRKCLLLSLVDSVSNVSMKLSGVSKGVEFSSFKPNRIIPARNVFFIGLDSNSFPGIEKKSVLDLRDDDSREDSLPKKNKNAFLCQIRATSDCFSMSYVNKNLQKDEDFYPSSVINAVRSFDKTLEEKRWGIDETDEPDNLFTFRRLRNYHNQHVSTNNLLCTGNTGNYQQPDEQRKATISQLRRFLEEPLKFQAENAFAYDEDTEKDNEEFEPVELDNLSLSAIRKKWIAREFDEKDFKKDLSAILPDGDFGKKQEDNLKKELNAIREAVYSIGLIEALAEAPELDVSFVKYQQYTRHSAFYDRDYECALHQRDVYYNEDYLKSGKMICCTIVKKENDPTQSAFAASYATAISMIAKEESADRTFDIELYVIDNDHPARNYCFKPDSMSHDEAVTLLENILKDKVDCDEGKFPSTLNVNSRISKVYGYKYPEKQFKTNHSYIYSRGFKEIDNRKVDDLTGKDVPYLVLYLKKNNPEGKKEMATEGSLIRTEIKKTKEQFQRFQDIDWEDIKKERRILTPLELLHDQKKTVGEPLKAEISGTVSIHNEDYKDSKRLTCIDIKSKDDLKSFLNGYVSSLLLIAAISDASDMDEYHVNLYVVQHDGKYRKKLFHISKKNADSLLYSIYDSAFAPGKVQKCFPIEAFYDKRLTNPEYFDLAEFVSGENGPWYYFNKSSLIDPADGFGYDPEKDFKEQWNEQKKLMSALLEPLSPETEFKNEEEAEDE